PRYQRAVGTGRGTAMHRGLRPRSRRCAARRGPSRVPSRRGRTEASDAGPGRSGSARVVGKTNPRTTMAPAELDHGHLLDSLDVAVIALAPQRGADGAIVDFTWVYANRTSLDVVGARWDD